MPGKDQLKEAQKALLERPDIKEWEEKMLKNYERNNPWILFEKDTKEKGS